MTEPVRIALDAMGGDVGPPAFVEGAALALARRPDMQFQFFGREGEIKPLLAARPALAAASQIIHTDVAVGAPPPCGWRSTR